MRVNGGGVRKSACFRTQGPTQLEIPVADIHLATGYVVGLSTMSLF